MEFDQTAVLNYFLMAFSFIIKATADLKKDCAIQSAQSSSARDQMENDGLRSLSLPWSWNIIQLARRIFWVRFSWKCKLLELANFRYYTILICSECKIVTAFVTLIVVLLRKETIFSKPQLAVPSQTLWRGPHWACENWLSLSYSNWQAAENW